MSFSAPVRSRNALVGAICALFLFACQKPVCPAAQPQTEPRSEATANPLEFALAELSIDDLQRKMENGELTSRQIVELYLERIDAIDRRGPSLHAVLEINPDALTIADALDRERRTRGARGPLHGIPILLKDNIGTADATETTAGSLALVGAKPPRDSFVAARLRAAGAVIIGKANLSEWANFRSGHSSSGWSARGGQTRNPYVLDRSPCGSSSGSGTATAASASRSQADYTAYLDPGRLKGARIGVSRVHFGADPAVDRLMADAIELMRSQGAEIVDLTDMPADSVLEKPEMEILLYEFKADINQYLAGVSGDGPRSLAELIAFNEAHADEEMPFFGQELFLMAEEKGDLEDPKYLASLREGQQAARHTIDSAMDQHQLDAICAPSGSPAWPIDLVNGDHFRMSSSTAAAVAGYPNITVPAGHVQGLPVGISFYGRAWSEPVLLGIAYAFEQASRARRAPELLPTLSPEPASRSE